MKNEQPKGKDWYRSQLLNAYRGLESSAYCTHHFLVELNKMREALVRIEDVGDSFSRTVAREALRLKTDD